jgi:hypothetical protein
MVTLWRGLILVVVGPLLLLIPVLGSMLTGALAIGLTYFLIQFILNISGRKLRYTVGIVTVIEVVLFTIYSLDLIRILL